jgi:hypothetical protein
MRRTEFAQGGQLRHLRRGVAGGSGCGNAHDGHTTSRNEHFRSTFSESHFARYRNNGGLGAAETG